MTKAALFVLAAEIVAVAALVYGIAKVIRDGLAEHKAKKAQNTDLPK